MPPWYLPIAGGEPSRTRTLPPPADEPMMTIWFGSPPNAAMLLIVHWQRQPKPLSRFWIASYLQSSNLVTDAVVASDVGTRHSKETQRGQPIIDGHDDDILPACEVAAISTRAGANTIIEPATCISKIPIVSAALLSKDATGRRTYHVSRTSQA